MVVRLKRILGIKKVGHMGTLDPSGSGVLIVGVGRATKLFDYFQTKPKEYKATFKFGEETDTLDSDGEIVKTNDVLVSKNEIKKVLKSFLGKIQQIPPKYSAVKIGGKKAYSLARKNVSFEIKPKEVEIFNIEVTESGIQNVFDFKVICSSGTYIRSLGRDIAEKLGTYASMISIIRTRLGDFDIQNSALLHEIESEPAKYILSVKELLKNEDNTIKEKFLKEEYNG